MTLLRKGTLFDGLVVTLRDGIGSGAGTARGAAKPAAQGKGRRHAEIGRPSPILLRKRGLPHRRSLGGSLRPPAGWFLLPIPLLALAGLQLLLPGAVSGAQLIPVDIGWAAGPTNQRRFCGLCPIPDDPYVAACVWDNGTKTLLPSNGLPSAAVGLNDSGRVVGYVDLNPEGVEDRAPVRWDGLTMTFLGEADFLGTGAYGVSDAGVIVGVGGVELGNCGERAVRWENLDPVMLPSPPGWCGHAKAANNQGQVVGQMRDPVAYHACFWEGGNMTVLPPPSWTGAYAMDNNEAGHIVGYSGYGVPRFWEGGSPTALPILAGSTGCFAVSINESDMVVGNCRYAAGDRAVKWTKQEGSWAIIDLNTLVDIEPAILTYSSGINDSGDIGVGCTGCQDEHHFFLLLEGCDTRIPHESSQSVYNSRSPDPNRIVDSQLSFETVDLFDGGLQLGYVDVRFAGNHGNDWVKIAL